MAYINQNLRIWWIFGICCLLGLASSQDGNENIYLLESYPSYSVVLPLAHENSSKNETFVIQSPRFHRVSAVIQFLNLPFRNDFTCGVFLQFQDGADQRSAKICGNFDPEEKSYAPSSLIGPRSYISSRNFLRVSLLHTTAGKLDKAYARIAFTAFRDDCYFLQPRHNWPNSTTSAGLPRYRPCEYAVTSDGIGRQCIVSSLFCDNVIHCAPTDPKTGSDFGQDESELNCPRPQIYQISTNHQESSPQIHEYQHNKESGNEIDTTFKRFFDEREEHLANLFKSAIIGFVGICTICILVAFVISMFCIKQNYDRTSVQSGA